MTAPNIPAALARLIEINAYARFPGRLLTRQFIRHMVSSIHPAGLRVGKGG